MGFGKKGKCLKIRNIGFTVKVKGHKYSIYSCSCGEFKRIRDYHVKSGRVKSCGDCRVSVYQTRLYKIWSAMKQRCINQNHNMFNRYGGRGITVCGEWMESFSTFKNWAITNSYNDDLTIDRINNDKGYSPDNCQWLTSEENTIRMLNSNYLNQTGQFSEQSLKTLIETNRERLGKRFEILKDGIVVYQSKCLIEGAEFINGSFDCKYDTKTIKKNISACLNGKRKNCLGYTFNNLPTPTNAIVFNQ